MHTYLFIIIFYILITLFYFWMEISAGHATLFEHIILSGIIGIPILGCCLLGYGSLTMIYGYVLIFDMLRCLGHCNFEFISHQLFEAIPLLKYLIYTPT